MGGMGGHRRKQSRPGGDVGQSQCSWQKAGVRPGIPETGAGGGEAPGLWAVQGLAGGCGTLGFLWSSWEQAGGGWTQRAPGGGGRAAEGFRRDRGSAGMLSRQWGPRPRPAHLPQ